MRREKVNNVEWPSFWSQRKKQNKIKQVRDLDDLNKDALSLKMINIYITGIYPMAEKLVKEMEMSTDVEGTSRSGFRYYRT